MNNEDLGKYVVSSNEEHFGSVFFDTKDEAIDEIKEVYKGESAFVGRVAMPTISIDAYCVLEDIGEQLYAEVGDSSENFTWGKEEEAKVQLILDKALEEILKVVPLDCFKVDDIEEITA